MVAPLRLTGRERTFPDEEFIVTKTDMKGRILYGNKLFCEISGYEEAALLGKPHSVIRHPHMPRAIFKMLWDSIQRGEEIFAYVVNRASNGDHYWVFAHVTPSIDGSGKVVGYHSSRRRVTAEARSLIEEIYKRLRQTETKYDDRKRGLTESCALLQTIVKERGFSDYGQFVLSI